MKVFRFIFGITLKKGLQASLIFFSYSLWALDIRVDPVSGARVETGGEAPQYLYHWTTLEQLARMAGDKGKNDKFPTFRKLDKRARSVLRWPQLERAPQGALFTWSHPITAMGSGGGNYGDIPLKLEIDTQRAKVLRLMGPSSAPASIELFRGRIDLNNVDIVFVSNDNINEWLVLNPKIIKNWTADPRVLKKEYENQLRLLQDPNYIYPPDTRHYDVIKGPGALNKSQSGLDYRAHLALVIENFLKMPPSNLPSFFLRDEEGKYTGEEWNSGTYLLKRPASAKPVDEPCTGLLTRVELPNTNLQR